MKSVLSKGNNKEPRSKSAGSALINLLKQFRKRLETQKITIIH